MASSSFEAIMDKFLEEFNSKTDDDFSKEFTSLKSQSQKYKEGNRYPSSSGQLSINRKKNRFKDILPFEYTRVELHPVEGVDGSDYINANYILGADGEICYIASQGPLPNTLEDFWRMLWYHNIEVVVMACREVEMGKKKCEKYWPVVHHSVQHGAISITTLKEDNISNDFVIRDFSVECQGEKQSIRQYHYNAWPDHGKPDSPDPIINMIELINDFRKRKDVPLVIHCSAGCGRTGTLIGIDIARAQLLSKDVPEDFSVFKIVEKMRQQRPAMVQAKDQYSFVYSAVAELSQRSIGLNPTVPPKPTVKPATAAPKLSYINIDTDNPKGSQSSSQTPPTTSSSKPPSTANGPTKPKTPGKFPPLPDKASSSSSTTTTTTSPKDEHLYQNVLSGSQAPPTPLKPPGKAESESHSHPAVAARVQRNISSTPASSGGHAPPPTPAEKTKDDDKSHPLPMPKPRARSKKGNDVTAASAGPAAHSSAIQPPSKPMVPMVTSRPTPGVPKPAPPSVTPRVKVSVDDSLPPLSEKPPKLPDRLESPTRTVVTATEEWGKVQPVADEDEFGYGVVDISESANPPAVPKSPRPAITEPGKNSMMDTFRDILGDELVQTIERQKSPPPVTPTSQGVPLLPPSNSSPRKNPGTPSSRPLPVVPIILKTASTSSLDFNDVPPEVPCRTDARLELVDSAYEAVPAPPTLGGVSPPSGSDYEQPTPPSKSLTASTSMQLHKSPPTSSQSSLSASNTFSRNSSTSSSVLSKGTGKFGSIFNKLNKKTDSKKKNTATSVEDLSSVTTKTVSSSMSSSQSSLERNGDDKYKFPGPLGFGIRLDRPAGPREEPGHWKSVPIPSPIKVT